MASQSKFRFVIAVGVRPVSVWLVLFSHVGFRYVVAVGACFRMSRQVGFGPVLARFGMAVE